MVLKVPFYIFFFILLNAFCFSQEQNLDSLENIIKTHKKDDTIKANVLTEIAWSYRNEGEREKGFLYANQAIALSEKLQFAKGSAKAKNLMGVLYMDGGDFNEALASYSEALKIRQTIDDKPGVAWCYNNIGVVLEKQGSYDLALKNHFTALKIRESIDDKAGMAASYNNIGQIYMSLENNNEALRYCTLSLQIKKKLKGNSQSIAQSYTNLGIIYHNLQNYSLALKNYNSALEISLANNNKRSIANLYNNIATVYNHIGEYEKSIQYSLMSLDIKEKIGDKLGIASSLTNLGMVNINKRNFNAARKYLNQGLKLSFELGNKSGIGSTYDLLSQLDSSENKYKGAYENYKLYIRYRDSLLNEENRKKTMETHLQYEFDKKAAADSVKTVEAKKVLTIQLEKEKTQRFALYSGLGLVALFAGFMFNRFRVTQKQKKIIEVQKLEVEKQRDIIEQAKDLVEEKQVEILDSIKYAKTLQEAILPSKKMFQDFLPDSFLLYKPKDIVAGDFYWMHVDELQKSGASLVLLAAADCTGHGVPGAMVSVVCSNALNRAVKEFGFTDPGQILDKTRELVIETFEKSDKEVKDGMDIVLCALKESGNDKFILKYAGANNSLWYRKNNIFYEIKADKQPIGKHINQKSFTTHSIELYKGDSFYIFTDGYPDQFGGEKGKKFKYKQLQDLLMRNAGLNMQMQRKTLDLTFETWKGGLEQVDDVCIIGVRV